MSVAPEAPVIPSPLGRGQRATEVFIDELVGQHDGGPRRHSPAPVVRIVCEYCRQAEPEGWVRTLAHVQRDLVAVRSRQRSLTEQGAADLRELGDLAMTITCLLDELVDIYTKGIIR